MGTAHRITLRVEEKKKRVIATAAELAGQTLTQYMMGLVWPDAEKRVAENYHINGSSGRPYERPPCTAGIVEPRKPLPRRLSLLPGDTEIRFSVILQNRLLRKFGKSPIV